MKTRVHGEKVNIIDENPALWLLQRVDVGDVADVSLIYPPSSGLKFVYIKVNLSMP
jgi:hypothetical protein